MIVSESNRAFWSELCGTTMARSLGITELTPDALARFDAAYFDYYPYLLPLVERAASDHGRVLEVGVGFGSLGQRIAEFASEYHALDIAAAPVSLLRQRLASIGAPPDRVLQGSALALPYADDLFDTVISIGALHHTGDLPCAISEVRRVLRPGGRALVMVYNRYSLRRLAAVPRLRVAALLRPVSRSVDERIRGMYDQRIDGSVAPHTDFVSRGAATRLFRQFRSVRIECRNFDDYLVGGRTIRRAWFLGNVDRVLGLDLYIAATK